MSVTPSQTVGPYFRIGLIRDEWTQLAQGAHEIITVRGRVLDSSGAPVVDAMLEVWQPDQRRFGRFETDPSTGGYEFRASTPTRIEQPDGSVHAPHLVLGVFARGLLKRLYTRIYFDGEPLNASDPILALAPPQRRSTLVARSIGEHTFGFDIRLSGEGETVFFEC